MVISEFVRRGIEVYTAVGPYSVDLIAMVGGRSYAVQVKASCGDGPRLFRFRRCKNQLYPKGTVDLFAVVDIDSGSVALIRDMNLKSATVDFAALNPEWDFDNVVKELCEGGKG